MLCRQKPLNAPHDQTDGAMSDKAEAVLVRHQRGHMGADKARDDLNDEIGGAPLEEHCLPFNSFA
jgi:hypothetical protein